MPLHYIYNEARTPDQAHKVVTNVGLPTPMLTSYQAVSHHHTPTTLASFLFLKCTPTLSPLHLVLQAFSLLGSAKGKSFSSSRIQFKYHLLRETFPGNLLSSFNAHITVLFQLQSNFHQKLSSNPIESTLFSLVPSDKHVNGVRILLVLFFILSSSTLSCSLLTYRLLHTCGLHALQTATKIPTRVLPMIKISYRVQTLAVARSTLFKKRTHSGWEMGHRRGLAHAGSSPQQMASAVTQQH